MLSTFVLQHMFCDEAFPRTKAMLAPEQCQSNAGTRKGYVSAQLPNLVLLPPSGRPRLLNHRRIIKVIASLSQGNSVNENEPWL